MEKSADSPKTANAGETTTNINENSEKKDSDVATDEEWKVQRDQFKSLGDQAFKVRDFEGAIHQYTQALSVDPDNHILLSNRSAAYLSSQQKSKALHDAQQCVKVMPDAFFKGFSRLAAALQSLGRYEQAMETWEKVLKKDKNNAAAKKGFEDSKKVVQELKAAEETKKTNDTDNATTTGAANSSNDDKKEDDGDDLLDDFFNDVETAVEKTKVVVEEEVQQQATNAIANHKKDLKNAEYQIERLLKANYQWRNLNPFFVLDLDHRATEDDISRRYKALSLLLHPDKNSHKRAQEAYDEVQKAKTKLGDENKASHVRQLAERGMKQGKYDWDNSDKKDSLQDMQSRAIQKIFAQIEHKRREVESRQKSQEQRERQQEQDEIDKERKERQFNKNWKAEERVEKRIGNWRDFSKKKMKK